MKIIITILVLAAIGFGVYTYIPRTTAPATPPTPAFNDADMKVTFVEIPDENNSVIAFNKLPAFDAQTLTFFDTYFKNFTPTKLPPTVRSQQIVTKYKSTLDTFNAEASKDFGCYTRLNKPCLLSSLIKTKDLVATRALLSYQLGKYADAKKSAQSIVDFGKKLTKSSNGEILSMLAGWQFQKTGYDVLKVIKQKDASIALSAENKESIIKTLRDEHRQYLKSNYTVSTQLVDYITSATNRPTDIFIDQENEDMAAEYRKSSNDTTWKPEETKKYFYDTYKKAIEYVALPCGSTYPSVKITFTELEPNSVGKEMYTNSYADLNSLNDKRCEVEKAILAL